MRILITGGAGSVGRHLTGFMLEHGHQVRVLDLDLQSLQGINHPRLELVAGSTGDASLVRKAAEGQEVIIHLAWSFADGLAETFEKDVLGLVRVLDAARAVGVKHVIYTSSAVVYGQPVEDPIAEEHPCLVMAARKPIYALSKLTTEQICQVYAAQYGFPVSVIRFWWAYGKEIGGSNLRKMMASALKGGEIAVPAGAGGSFLHLEDLSRSVASLMLNPGARGEIYNLATAYVSWEEIAQMITGVTGTGARVRVIPAEQWDGPAFLAGCWRLDTRKAEKQWGYRSVYTQEHARELLRQAIRMQVEQAG